MADCGYHTRMGATALTAALDASVSVTSAALAPRVWLAVALSAQAAETPSAAPSSLESAHVYAEPAAVLVVEASAGRE